LFLSLPALLVICGYSLIKRFSSLSHFVLGLSLGIAPVGAWIAVTGRLSGAPLLLTGGVVLWVAGFDVIYALLDEEFDRRIGLHSLVVRLGKEKALRVAFASHILSVVMVTLFGWVAGLGWIFFAGTFGYAALILYEHRLVDPNDVARINLAFFNVNGVISIGLFLITLADVLVLR
jgi:4-hydroxybenzoate polyprenyltransferase